MWIVVTRRVMWVGIILLVSIAVDVYSCFSIASWNENQILSNRWNKNSVAWNVCNFSSLCLLWFSGANLSLKCLYNVSPPLPCCRESHPSQFPGVDSRKIRIDINTRRPRADVLLLCDVISFLKKNQDTVIYLRIDSIRRQYMHPEYIISCLYSWICAFQILSTVEIKYNFY